MEARAANIKSAVVVEVDREWIAKVQQQSEIRQCMSRGELHFVLVDINADPTNGSSPRDESMRDNWLTYAAAIAGASPIPDLVFVDGRFRVACCLRAWLVMADDGLLVVHDYGPGNQNRTHYNVIQQFFEPVEQDFTLYVFRKKQAKAAELQDVLGKPLYNPR